MNVKIHQRFPTVPAYLSYIPYEVLFKNAIILFSKEEFVL